MTPRAVQRLFLSTSPEDLARLEESVSLPGSGLHPHWRDALRPRRAAGYFQVPVSTLSRTEAVALAAYSHTLLSHLPAYPRASALAPLVQDLAVALSFDLPAKLSTPLTKPLRSLLALPSWALEPEWVLLLTETLPTLGLAKSIKAAELLREHPHVLEGA